MLTRIITIALAASSLTFAAAQAQSGSNTGGGTTSGITMSPGTSVGAPGAIKNGTGGTMGIGSSATNSSGATGPGQIAQQPAGAFNASQYKTKTECMSAAKSANASSSGCDTLP